MTSLAELKEAIAEVQHHQRIRKRYGAKGIFDISQHLDSFGGPTTITADEANGDASIIKPDDRQSVPRSSSGQASALKKELVKRELKKQLLKESSGEDKSELETTINGKKILSSDYAVRWLNLDHSTMDSTHEITCNPKDPGFLWVTGMMDNQLAKISVKHPTHAQFFQFPKGVQPHTVRFDNNGGCWVGLEYAGLIVKLKNVNDWTDDNSAPPGNMTLTPEQHYDVVLDVRIQVNKPSIPFPINTHPHGFCFDATQEHIWFTGKLTNTVGRVNIKTSVVQHYELPTLGAVPIYVVLGPDDNVWGTCLANNNIFRVTTTGECPKVTEIPITATSENSRPIAIKRAPNGERFMWFSNEATHTVAKVDCDKVEQFVQKETEKKKKKKQASATTTSTESQKDNDGGDGGRTCTCSNYFYAASSVQQAITEFPIPRPQSNMLMAGIAFDDEGNLWTQSYVDSGNPEPTGPDYVIKVDKCIHKAKMNALGKGRITGIPFEYYEAPTRETIMHRIINGPDGNVWFTELGADRIGTVKITPVEKHISE